MTGCRIGRVKMKNGAEVLRFPKPERSETVKKFVTAAVEMAGFEYSGGMTDFVIIAFAKDGTHSTAFELSGNGHIGTTSGPAVISDIVRRRLIQDGVWA